MQTKTHYHTLSCSEDGSVPAPPLDLKDNAEVTEVHIELVSHWCLARLLSLQSLCLRFLGSSCSMASMGFAVSLYWLSTCSPSLPFRPSSLSYMILMLIWGTILFYLPILLAARQWDHTLCLLLPNGRFFGGFARFRWRHLPEHAQFCCQKYLLRDTFQKFKQPTQDSIRTYVPCDHLYHKLASAWAASPTTASSSAQWSEPTFTSIKSLLFIFASVPASWLLPSWTYEDTLLVCLFCARGQSRTWV